MKCLRCGYCCIALSVVIVDDPPKGIVEGNLKFNSEERCQHLQGDKIGQFACAVHNESWYKKTPCFSHGQVSVSPDDPCRMGVGFTTGRLDPSIFLGKGNNNG